MTLHIPRAWAQARATARHPDGCAFPVTVWGWGEDQASARQCAANRLKPLLARIERGELFPDPYGYASRPLREEILETFPGRSSGEPRAMVTRNSYGARVLNAARLLFLDVDLQPAGPLARALRLFGARTEEERVRARLPAALQQYGRGSFRIYRTASGLRVMGVDRAFDPESRDVQQLMAATGTDPAFARLCLVQRSFRARLTPKPWRCNMPLPPGQYPRTAEARQSFAAWLADYEKASAQYATCRYLETIGNGRPAQEMMPLIELHDRLTRCHSSLPLA